MKVGDVVNVVFSVDHIVEDCNGRHVYLVHYGMDELQINYPRIMERYVDKGIIQNQCWTKET